MFYVVLVIRLGLWAWGREITELACHFHFRSAYHQDDLLPEVTLAHLAEALLLRSLLCGCFSSPTTSTLDSLGGGHYGPLVGSCVPLAACYHSGIFWVLEAASGTCCIVDAPSINIWCPHMLYTVDILSTNLLHKIDIKCPSLKFMICLAVKYIYSWENISTIKTVNIPKLSLLHSCPFLIDIYQSASCH